MKKDLLKFVFASVFAVVAGYSVYASQQKVEMTGLAMANVEALAQNEDEGILDCPNGCLDRAGHCFCYGYHPYEEMTWK